jgi:outer membrane lipopolysaccharide assembly protein LptE/RlpB
MMSMIAKQTAALTAAVLSLVCASMSGCGFQLAGSGAMPNVMATTYVQTTEPNSVFFDSMREALRMRGLDVVTSPDDAGARLIMANCAVPPFGASPPNVR